MTDISKEAGEASAEDQYDMFVREIRYGDRVSVNTKNALGEYDVSTFASKDLSQTLRAQSARIAELEAALKTAREDALREAAGIIGEVNIPIGKTSAIWDAQDAILALINKEPTS